MGDKMLLNDEFLVMNYARQQKLITHNSNLIVLKTPFSSVCRGWKYCLNSGTPVTPELHQLEKVE